MFSVCKPSSITFSISSSSLSLKFCFVAARSFCPILTIFSPRPKWQHWSLWIGDVLLLGVHFVSLSLFITQETKNGWYLLEIATSSAAHCRSTSLSSTFSNSLFSELYFGLVPPLHSFATNKASHSLLWLNLPRQFSTSTNSRLVSWWNTI